VPSICVVRFGIKFGEPLLRFLPQGRRSTRDVNFPNSLNVRHATVEGRNKLAQVTSCGRQVGLFLVHHRIETTMPPVHVICSSGDGFFAAPDR
jgi:hypothetical protein